MYSIFGFPATFNLFSNSVFLPGAGNSPHGALPGPLQGPHHQEHHTSQLNRAAGSLTQVRIVNIQVFYIYNQIEN